MIRGGIIHAELATWLAGLRHTEIFVICDAGLPLGKVPTIDLGYRYGSPPFGEVVSAVMPEIVAEGSWVSQPMAQHNPENLAKLHFNGLLPELLDHDVFKQRVLGAKFAIRTGEATRYANVLIQAGVAF